MDDKLIKQAEAVRKFISSKESANKIKETPIQEWAIEFEFLITNTQHTALKKSLAILQKLREENDLGNTKKNTESVKKYHTELVELYKNALNEFLISCNRLNFYTSMDLFETKEFRAAKSEIESSLKMVEESLELVNQDEKVDTQPPNQNYPNIIPQKTAWLGNMQELSALLKALKGQKKIGENVWVFMGEHFTKEDGKEINTDQARKDFPKISDSTSKKMNTLVKDVLKNDQNNSGT